MNIVKRNNTIEQFSKDKLLRFIDRCTIGLDNVDSQLILENTTKLIRNGNTTIDIYNILLKQSIDLIEEYRSNYEYVASRIFLYNLYKEVNNCHGYCHIRDYFENGVKHNKLMDNFYKCYDLDKINSHIKPERDLNFKYISIKTVYDRYLLKDSNGKAIELPQHMFMAIAMFLAHREENREELAIQWYDILSTFKAMVATPILSNCRTNRNQLSSCYVTTIPDNIEGIFNSYKEMGLYSKYGGGIGVDITEVRSVSSTIDGNINASKGIIPFTKIMNDMSSAVDQLGIRKCSIAVYLQIWHRDILDFIDLRKNSGDERKRCHDLFPAVWICDLFMNRVEQDLDFSLFDPIDTPKLITSYGSEFDKYYLEYESNSKINRTTIKAKELWKRILVNYFESGLPFLGFKDTCNIRNPNDHIGIIRSSNLCVSGNTKILTKEYGNTEIGSLVEQGIEYVNCWNGNEWSNTKIFKTSEKQKVLEVKLSNDAIIEATTYHRWLVINDFNNNKPYIVETKDLKPNMKLIKFDLPKDINKGYKDLPYAYDNGLFTADGTVYIDKKGIERKIIHLYTEKIKLYEHIKSAINDLKVYYMSEKYYRKTVKLNNEVIKDKFFIPSIDYKLEHRIQWLSGLLDGDGYTDNQTIQIASINIEFLNNLKSFLLELGINSRIKLIREKDQRLLPTNRLVIANSGIKRLLDLGLKTHRLKLSYRHFNRQSEHYIKVVSVKDNNKQIPTYCGNEPKLNRLVFNGILTMNCTEIIQNTKPDNSQVNIVYEDNTKTIHDENDILFTNYGFVKAKKVNSLYSVNDKKVKYATKIDNPLIYGETAVCNLASINLSKVNKTSDIEYITKHLVRMLDNIIDLNFYPHYKAQMTNQSYRSIGIGIMGEANYLANSKIMFGSEKHIYEIDRIMEDISYFSIKSSCNLAKEKGSYKHFKGSKWSKGILPIHNSNSNALKLCNRKLNNDWKELSKNVSKYGIRNGYLLAIAPTSSISIVCGTSQTIEPIYKRKWYEENLSGMIPVIANDLNIDNYRFYISAYNINQQDIVKVASIRQKWIDQGQSLNIFMNIDNVSGKQLSDLYMLAWKLGVKTTYYLRTKSPEINDNTMDRSIECEGCQ